MNKEFLKILNELGQRRLPVEHDTQESAPDPTLTQTTKMDGENVGDKGVNLLKGSKHPDIPKTVLEDD